MNKRQKQVQQSLLKNELAVIKQLEQSYEKAIKDIDGILTDLSKRTDVWNKQSIIYQEKYQKALKKELEAFLKVLHTNNYTLIDDYLNECYKDGHIGTLFDLQGQGVPLMLPLNQEQMISAITLNSKLSAPLYNHLGYNTEVLKIDVMREISRGIAQSLSYEEIARNLKNTTNVDFNKSLRIAKTEGHRIQCESAYNVQVGAKARGAKILKQWDSTLDSRTRPSHQAVDGELVEVEEVFSNGLMYPGDPNGSASEVVNCRCALLQRAEWALEDEDFKKFNGETNELQDFSSLDDYEDFKEMFWEVTE